MPTPESCTQSLRCRLAVRETGELSPVRDVYLNALSSRISANLLNKVSSPMAKMPRSRLGGTSKLAENCRLRMAATAASRRPRCAGSDASPRLGNGALAARVGAGHRQQLFNQGGCTFGFHQDVAQGLLVYVSSEEIVYKRIGRPAQEVSTILGNGSCRRRGARVAGSRLSWSSELI